MRCGDALNQLDYGEFLIDECREVIRLYDEWNSDVRRLHAGNSHGYLREIKLREPPLADHRLCPRSPRAIRSYPWPIDPIPPTTEPLSFRIQPSAADAAHEDRRKGDDRGTRHLPTIRPPGASARGPRRPRIPGEKGAMSSEAQWPPTMQVFRDHRETKQKIFELEAAFHDSLVASATHIRDINRTAARKRTGALPLDLDFWVPRRKRRETAPG